MALANPFICVRRCIFLCLRARMCVGSCVHASCIHLYGLRRCECALYSNKAQCRTRSVSVRGWVQGQPRLSLCVCVCVCVFVCVCVNLCVFMCMYVCVCMYGMCVCVCVSENGCAIGCVCTYVFLYMCMCV